MDVIITGKKIEITPGLKKYIESRAKKIEKYTTKATQVAFILKSEKYRNIAEITVTVKGQTLKAQEETDDDIHASVDLAMTRLESQLKKQKEKLSKHHPRHGEAHGDLRRLIGKTPPPETPKKTASRIKKKQKQAVELMTLEEAEIKLQTLEQGFLLFGNQKSFCLNVLYKRADGSLGLIETIYTH